MKKLLPLIWNSQSRALASTAAATLLLFFVSVGFSLFLSAATLRQYTTESILTGYENAAGQLQTLINRGLNFGRPLDGFISLSQHLENTLNVAPGISGIAVYDKNEKIIAATADAQKQSPEALLGAAAIFQTSWKKQGDYYRILPLGLPQAKEGYLVISVAQDKPDAPYQQYLHQMLILAFLIGPLVCLGLLGWIVNAAARSAPIEVIRKRMRLLILIFIGGSQFFFVGLTARQFFNELEQSSTFSAKLSAELLADNLEILSHKGLKIQNFPGLQEHMEQIVESSSGLGGIQLLDGSSVLASAGSDFSLTPATAEVCQYWATAETPRVPIASVSAFPDKNQRNAILLRVFADQLTAMIIAFMLLLQFSSYLSVYVLKYMGGTEKSGAKMRQGSSPNNSRPNNSNQDNSIHVSTVIFLFFCAYDMLTSFIPLAAAQLPSHFLPLSESLHKALPISTEAMFATVGVFLSGILNRRLGWKKMIWLCTAAAFCGSILGCFSIDIAMFILSRACSGFAMGMIIMAAQFSVMETSQKRLSGIAGIFAALFAGSICGTASGGMLYDLLNFHTIFFISAVLMLLPALGLIPVVDTSIRTEKQPKMNLQGIGKAFFKPSFLCPVLLVSFPAGMTLTGFLYLCFPVLMQQMSFDQADIGRLFMLYGFCFVFIGPNLAKYAQTKTSQAPFVALTGLSAGLSIALVSFFPTLAGFSAAALLMGISQCLLSSSVMEYILSLPSMQKFDSALLGSIYRVCERSGQIAGPIVFGAVLVGGSTYFLLTGIALASAAVLFFFIQKIHI